MINNLKTSFICLFLTLFSACDDLFVSAKSQDGGTTEVENPSIIGTAFYLGEIIPQPVNISMVKKHSNINAAFLKLSSSNGNFIISLDKFKKAGETYNILVENDSLIGLSTVIINKEVSDTINIELNEPVSFSGNIFDAITKTPLDSVSVSVYGTGKSLFTNKGYFSFPLPKDTFMVVYSKSNYSVLSDTIYFQADTNVDSIFLERSVDYEKLKPFNLFGIDDLIMTNETSMDTIKDSLMENYLFIDKMDENAVQINVNPDRIDSVFLLEMEGIVHIDKWESLDFILYIRFPHPPRVSSQSNFETFEIAIHGGENSFVSHYKWILNPYHTTGFGSIRLLAEFGTDNWEYIGNYGEIGYAPILIHVHLSAKHGKSFLKIGKQAFSGFDVAGLKKGVMPAGNVRIGIKMRTMYPGGASSEIELKNPGILRN